MPSISYYTHKEGLETYNDSIKIFILLLCTSKEIIITIIEL